jgi:hypothetical protein
MLGAALRGVRDPDERARLVVEVTERCHAQLRGGLPVASGPAGGAKQPRRTRPASLTWPARSPEPKRVSRW